MRRANARNPKCGEIGRGGKNLGLNSLSEAPLGQANRLHERESPDGCEWLTSHKCDQVALRWNTRTPETDDRGRIRKVKREGNRIKKAQNTRRHGRTGARGVHGFDLTRPSSNSKVLVGSAPVSRMHLPGSFFLLLFLILVPLCELQAGTDGRTRFRKTEQRDDR